MPDYNNDSSNDDPGPPDLSPLPEGPPALIPIGLTLSPDVYLPEPIADGGPDWASFIKALGGGVSGGSKSFSKLFGGSGGSGLDGLLGLLALLGGIGTSINAGNTAKQNGQDIKAAADKSNEIAQGLFDKAQGNFSPYQQAGIQALAGLQTPSNLASKFNSAGTASNLASKFNGAMTLSQLAKR